jgi:hypothetical protein
MQRALKLSKKKHVLLMLTFLVALFVLIWTCYYLLILKSMSKRKMVVQKKQLHMSFDEVCESAAGEWESIQKDVFIKKSALFYFLDARFLRIHVLRRGSAPNRFGLFIEIVHKSALLDRKHEMYTNETRLVHGTSSGDYHFNLIDANFDLKSIVKNVKHVKIRVRVKELNTSNMTGSYLDVKVKNLSNDFGSKKGSMLCAKCFYMSEQSGYLPLKWWIEINRMGGYDRIQFCDHAVEKSANFERLFSDNRPFLHVQRLECIPNLQNQDKYRHFKYINYTRLEYEPTEKFDVTKMDTINQLILNECYLEHVDKYRYISSIDTDEVVIPKLVPHLINLDQEFAFMSKSDFENPELEMVKCDRFKTATEEKKQKFELFLDSVKEATRIIGQSTSYFVNQGYFLENEFMSHLFDSFERTLNSSVSSSSLKFNVTYQNTREGPFTFEVAISKQSELKYAKNLMNLYRRVVAPFLEKNKALIEKHVKNFDRLFATVGYLNSFALGKTIHNTNVTFDLSLHFMDVFYRAEATGTIRIIKDMHHEKAYDYLDSNYAHMSHFRKQQYFNYKTIDFRDVFFDFNYFQCYFKPILAKFSQ